jgi:hypothetical protein
MVYDGLGFINVRFAGYRCCCANPRRMAAPLEALLPVTVESGTCASV